MVMAESRENLAHESEIVDVAHDASYIFPVLRAYGKLEGEKVRRLRPWP